MAFLEEVILKTLAQAGPLAVLFFWALWDKSQLTKQVMLDSKEREELLFGEKRSSEKKSKEREERLMDCLSSLSYQYDNLCQDVDEVRVDVGEIKQEINILKERGKWRD